MESRLSATVVAPALGFNANIKILSERVSLRAEYFA